MHFRLCLCPHDFQQTLDFGREAATCGGTSDLNISKTFFMASEAAECLARLKVKVTAPWENVVQTLTNYFGQCGKADKHAHNFHSTQLKTWVMSVFHCVSWCPNYHIRLEMLKIIQLWVQHDKLSVVYIGDWLVSGLMSLSKYLSAEEHLITHDNRENLDSPWFRVMVSLIGSRHLDR